MLLRHLPVSVLVLLSAGAAVAQDVTCYDADPTLRFCVEGSAYVPFVDQDNQIIAGEFQSADASTELLMFSAILPEPEGMTLATLETLVPLTVAVNSGLTEDAFTSHGSSIVPHDGYELYTILYSVDFGDGAYVDYINSLYLEEDAVIQIMSLRNGTPGVEPTAEHGTIHLEMLRGVDIIPFNDG